METTELIDILSRYNRGQQLSCLSSVNVDIFRVSAKILRTPLA